MVALKRITVIRSGQPIRPTINEQLQWLGGSLGLFNRRDRDKSCFRIFITLLQRAKREEMLSSDAIAEQTGLSRGTVVHHLKKLIDAGLVRQQPHGYILEEKSLVGLIDQTRKSIDETLAHLREVAEQIDTKL